MATTNADLKLPRKRNNTITTKTSPPKPAFCKPEMEFLTYEDWSKITFCFTSSGIRAFKLGRAFFTSFTAAMVLAPGLLKIGR